MKLLLVFTALLFAAIARGDDHTITWPDSYSASGIVTLPYAEVTESFEAHMNLGAKKGRIDFNGG